MVDIKKSRRRLLDLATAITLKIAMIELGYGKKGDSFELIPNKHIHQNI